MSNKSIYTVLILIALLVAGSTLSISKLQGSNSSTWLVTVTPTDNPIGKNVTIKAWSYNGQNLETYQVSCNVTVTNGEDVILMDTFQGDPAIYNFTIWKPGNYELELYCIDNQSNDYSNTYSISFHFPETTVTPTTVDWGRYFNLSIDSEYQYNTSINVTVGSKTYSGYMVNGHFGIDGIALFNPTNVTVNYLNGTYQTVINITPPMVHVNVTPSQIKLGGTVRLQAYLYNQYGPQLVPVNLTYTVTGCGSPLMVSVENGEPYYYKPTGTGNCLFTAVLENGTIHANGSVSFKVLPPSITGRGVIITNTTDWSYNITAYVVTDVNTTGTLKLIIDGYEWNTTGTRTVFYIAKHVTFNPGKHSIQVLFSDSYGNTYSYEKEILVPRHPYKIEIKDNYKIYYGEDWRKILPDNPNYYYYTWKQSGNVMYVYAYYPGSSYYKPSWKLIKITYIEPKVSIQETVSGNGFYVDITNGKPGAKVTIYTIVNGKQEVIYQTTMQHDYLHKCICISGVYSLKLVYNYNGSKLVYYNNIPNPVSVLPECTAGVPCIPMYSKLGVTQVYIGGKPYTPGTKVTLKPGEYLVKVIMTDGIVETYTLTVKSLPYGAVKVYYFTTEPSHIIVDAPENYKVNVVLKDGRIITLTAGEYTLYEPVVNAFSPYTHVMFIPLTPLK